MINTTHSNRSLTAVDNMLAHFEPNKRYNILVVDDSEDDTCLLARQLTKNGLNIEYDRVDKAQALRNALIKQDWHIVISDHHMPGFSYEEAIKIIKDFDQDLPVILVSGEIDEDKAAQTMQQGAQDYVMKDNLTRLIPAIQREVRESESRHAKRMVEQNLEHLAYHDKLTGLSNRSRFEQELKDDFRQGCEHGTINVLMYLDLDQFKIINDTCGHIAGDELIRQVARCLGTHIRGTDTLARLGGDEFGILLRATTEEHATQFARRIREEIKAQHFVWQEKPYAVSISIGIVSINGKHSNVEEAMSAADIACYAAKEKGRDNATWYSDNNKNFDRMRNEMHWATKIKQAIDEDRFFLCQQPMIDMNTQQFGLQREFLVRLRDNGQVVPPALFIPAAERYNMMSMVDRWVVHNAFSYLHRTGLGNKAEGTYFINLSGSSLSDHMFFSDIRDYLKTWQINPNRICFEITETAAISRLSEAVEFISGIRDEGFKFALDDFGVGLSSFTYLKTIPVDFLKIDGSFVKNMLNDPIDQGIVKAINEIGHTVGLQTIAEFVEDQATLEALKKIGVDFAQGYGIAMPKPIDEE